MFYNNFLNLHISFDTVRYFLKCSVRIIVILKTSIVYQTLSLNVMSCHMVIQMELTDCESCWSLKCFLCQVAV